MLRYTLFVRTQCSQLYTARDSPKPRLRELNQPTGVARLHQEVAAVARAQAGGGAGGGGGEGGSRGGEESRELANKKVGR